MVDNPDTVRYLGKWLVFARKGDELDSLWKNIKKATKDGLLGNWSKVSTAIDNKHALDKYVGVVCVFTRDSRDVDDVHRVREVLRTLGVTWIIFYKREIDTWKGKYANKGDTGIALYKG